MRAPLLLTLSGIDHKTVIHLISNISQRSPMAMSNIPSLHQLGLRIEAVANETIDTADLEGGGIKCGRCYEALRYTSPVNTIMPNGFMELFAGVRALHNILTFPKMSPTPFPVGLCLYIIHRSSPLFDQIYRILRLYISDAEVINEKITTSHPFYHWYFINDDCVYINYIGSSIIIGLPTQIGYTRIYPYSNIGEWCCLAGVRMVAHWINEVKYSYSTDLIIHYTNWLLSNPITSCLMSSPETIISKFIDYNSVEMSSDEYSLAIFFINKW